MLAEVDDAARRPRTLTLHYLRPPAGVRARWTVTVERAGRGLTTVSARLVQDGRDCVLALAALGSDRPGPELHDHPAPDVPGPDDVPPRPEPPAGTADVPFRHLFETRPAIGSAPFTSGPKAETGGWIRTADDDPVDDVLIAAITDSWPPAVFSRLDVPVGVPTVELTIHFRGAPSGAPELEPRPLPDPRGVGRLPRRGLRGLVARRPPARREPPARGDPLTSVVDFVRYASVSTQECRHLR